MLYNIMKYLRQLLLCFSLLSTAIFFASGGEGDPLLVVTIMIKNEEEVICQTLQPFVDAGINSFFVLDTGSTDKTVEVTRNFFEKNHVTAGYIAQEPFVDFATSRNRALQLTQQQFSRAAFILMPDAEWYIQNVQGLLVFCKQYAQEDNPYASFLVRIMSDTLDFYTARLIKNNRSVYFVGAVHEVLNQVSPIKLPSDVYFKLEQTKNGAARSRRRWLRDCDILLKEYQKDVSNPRTLFYLAQTYAGLGQWYQAIHYYTLRTHISGWAEEDFMTQYRLAQSIERVINDGVYTWVDALSAYLKAYQIRPQRVEPLIKIAQHYWRNQEQELCYLFARRATEIPYPATDILFVDKLLYRFTRYDLLGMSAWCTGEYELGEWAVRKALAEKPHKIHLHKNLASYIKHREQKFLKQVGIA